MASNLGKGLGTGIGGAAGAALGPAGIFLGSSLGSVLGGLFDSGDEEAQKAIQNALRQYEGIIPPDLAKAIVYTQYQQGGSLTPQQLQSLPIEAQQAIQLVESPEMRQKQMVQQQALERLAQTGLGPQEKLGFEEAYLRAGQDAQARQQGLMQKYAQMGQAGGPASLAAQLSAQQQTAQNEMLENMKTAAQAAENRRGAIQMAMQGATQMRTQDLGVQQANVEAQRQRQIFDIQNAIARQQANAQYAQQANMMNLQRQQSVMDKNIQQQNEEAYRRGYLAPQQMYQNQLGLAQSKANAYTQQANLAQQQAAAQASGWGNVTAGLAQAGGSIVANKKNPWDWKTS